MIKSLPIRIVITLIGALLIMFRILQLFFDLFTQSSDSNLNTTNFILPALISIIAAIEALIILNRSRVKQTDKTKIKRVTELILWMVLIVGIVFSVQWQLEYVNWQTSKNMDLENLIFESAPAIFCGICSLLIAIFGIMKIKNTL